MLRFRLHREDVPRNVYTTPYTTHPSPTSQRTESHPKNKPKKNSHRQHATQHLSRTNRSDDARYKEDDEPPSESALDCPPPPPPPLPPPESGVELDSGGVLKLDPAFAFDEAGRKGEGKGVSDSEAEKPDPVRLAGGVVVPVDCGVVDDIDGPRHAQRPTPRREAPFKNQNQMPPNHSAPPPDKAGEYVQTDPRTPAHGSRA
ncbi:hypothetical protein EW146_g8620 [Bondarzewia mesenterica]|uniref:Uncharacterized protein n=1 Tax=Bondarzewia mesenterica TaxID=1095465 RepID=A0A4V3XDH2_9AGAM|nr:hypothetical protein EW146_g8620 [Bondarzewia mesenterica]